MTFRNHDFVIHNRAQDDTTLSTLLEAPYQAKLVEYLIMNVNVSSTSKLILSDKIYFLLLFQDLFDSEN